MWQSVQTYYAHHPLRVILFSGLFFRLVSAIFSEGYGFSDDHFFVIEVAQQWVDGVDTKAWMPWNGNNSPNGPSLFYPGLQFLFFKVLHALGFVDPAFNMFLVRLMHGLYSLLIIYFGFRIAKKFGGYELARPAGWMLALLWFMPLMSVRNAVEMVCIPPLLYATWILLKARESNRIALFAMAGFVAGIAFSIRFQCIIFIGGFGLYLLLVKQFRAMLIFGAGAIASILLLQGGIDWYIWGRPFAEFREYVQFNIENASNYITGPWYNYILLLAGSLVPPISLLMLLGLFKSWKKYALVILPAMCFFIFHSYFPNKQERFILPVIPFFIIAGIGGWQDLMKQIPYLLRNPEFYKNSWRIFWIINLPLLLILSPASTKTGRVNTMTYLYHQPDYHYFVFETTQMWGTLSMPLYYSGKWNMNYEITQNVGADSLFNKLQTNHKPLPEFIVFAEDKNLGTRILNVKKEVKDLTFEKRIESSYLDKLMHYLNPVNANQDFYIFRIVYE